MDSLLASYASLDEEEDHQQPPQHQSIPSKMTPSLFPSLPLPKSSFSSSLFNFLPPPKQPSSDTLSTTPFNFTGISSLPKPKSQIHEKPIRLVQLKTLIIPLPKPNLQEDEDDDEEEERNRRRKLESSLQTPSVKSLLFNITTPRNSSTLGVQSTSDSGLHR